MSRFDGWLVRYIEMLETPAAVSIRAAARGACVRPETFTQALRNPKLIREDARYLGIDADEMRSTYRWIWRMQAEDEVEESMKESVAARTLPKPTSDQCHAGTKRLGASHPGRSQRDHLGMLINPIEHPEPEGEWHAGLDAAG